MVVTQGFIVIIKIWKKDPLWRLSSSLVKLPSLQVNDYNAQDKYHTEHLLLELCSMTDKPRLYQLTYKDIPLQV